jgi:hypothetical protein
MRKLLGIVASPRKLGNCELLVKAIAERVPGSPALRILRLTEKEIRPCKGCYRGLQFWKHIEALDGKPAVAVATAGVPDGEGHALLGVENFLRGMGCTIRGWRFRLTALPRTVRRFYGTRILTV